MIQIPDHFKSKKSTIIDRRSFSDLNRSVYGSLSSNSRPIIKDTPPRTEEEMQHNEQSKLVLGGEGDKTKVRYANFDEEMIGMTTTVTNEDAAGAFGSQVSELVTHDNIWSQSGNIITLRLATISRITVSFNC